MHSFLTSKWTKGALFALCLVPLGLLVWQGLHNDLGANPIEFITHYTGDWTLRLIIIGLFVNVSTVWIPTELKNVGALGVLIIVLLVRPQGILGRSERIG